jgi:hypothetical protein
MKSFNYLNRQAVGGFVLALVFAAVPAMVRADDTNGVASTKPKPYPLSTCIVSGEKLGEDMGEPVVFVYRDKEKGIDQEVKFCCSSCKPKFLKDPDKYLKIVRAAEAKAKDAKN